MRDAFMRTMPGMRAKFMKSDTQPSSGSILGSSIHLAGRLLSLSRRISWFDGPVFGELRSMEDR